MCGAWLGRGMLFAELGLFRACGLMASCMFQTSCEINPSHMVFLIFIYVCVMTGVGDDRV